MCQLRGRLLHDVPDVVHLQQAGPRLQGEVQVQHGVDQGEVGFVTDLVHVGVHVLGGRVLRGLGADDQERVALEVGLQLGRDVDPVHEGVDVLVEVLVVDRVLLDRLLVLEQGLLLVLFALDLK